jgi:hypothetical protein
MQLKEFWLSIRIALIVAVVLLDSGHAYSQSSSWSSQMENALLQDQGFQSWKWLESSCDDCQIMLVPNSDEVQTIQVRRFIQALAVNKIELQKMYNVSGEEYTLLAQMSVGILGRETRFGESARYKVKEAIPWAVSLGKVMRSVTTGKGVDL